MTDICHGWNRLLCKQERNGDELYRVGDRDYDEDNVEQDGEEGVGGSPDADRLEVLKEYGRAKAGNKGDCSGNEKAAVAGDQDLPFRPAVEERSIGRRAVSIREKLSRLGRHHGLEIDDRLAEFLRCVCLRRRLKSFKTWSSKPNPVCRRVDIVHVGKLRCSEGHRRR